MSTGTHRGLAALAVLLAGPAFAADPPTAAEAKAFVDEADAKLLKLSTDAQQADWVKSTFITDDTEAIAARANQVLSSVQTDLAKQATRFDAVTVPDDVRRRLLLLKLYAVVPAPPDPAEPGVRSRASFPSLPRTIIRSPGALTSPPPSNPIGVLTTPQVSSTVTELLFGLPTTRMGLAELLS